MKLELKSWLFPAAGALAFGLCLSLPAAEPDRPKPPESAPKAAGALPPLDEVKFAGLSPDQAAKEMTLPPGFSAKVFAAEPDVKQPIAFAIDDRGRLWVAEGYTYPKRAPEGQGKDRILVFEDTDGDGKFDRRTVFMEKLNLVSGLEVGFGGVWLGAAPYLMFIPIQDGDEPKPAGEPKVLLDGWDFKRDTHETLNTFSWGPDGWLYGCHGVFCPSLVGKPGASEAERQWVDAAVWRYHPIKQRFEVFAEGTSNPWGIDFDAHGQCFIEACVIPHLFHIIQGGRFERQAPGHYSASLDEVARNEQHRDPKSRKPMNPYIYDDIKTIADHLHYRGNQWNDADRGTSWQLGGGHAHAGLLVYQGDSWPQEFRGKLFMNNIHGQRINMDVPERKGSGFAGHHGADFINFNDRWSQIVNLLSDQDGSVYMIDWYDKNQCHHNEVDAHDRANGRIFKIVYNGQKGTPVRLQQQDDAMLLKYLLHPNDWYARHARRILQERAGLKKLDPQTQRWLRTFLGLERAELDSKKMSWEQDPEQERSQLRLLWALHGTGGLSEADGRKLLGHKSEYVRAWTIQFLAEDKTVSPALLKEFARLATEDKSPVVRLYLASALQRVPVAQRAEVLEGLLAHAEDADDHNLPLMYWYATEPVAGENPAGAITLLGKAKIPVVRKYITRRTTASSAKKTAAAK